MAASILYCGDTRLDGAAAYLAGVLTHAGEDFEYVASDVSIQDASLGTDLRLVILSDYPAANFSEELQHQFINRIANGTGLLMIGGWESFHGLGGDWDIAALGELLPVEIAGEDDRLNSDRPLLVRRAGTHAITDGLPWETHPPYVGGLNRFQPKSDARVLLETDALVTAREGGDWRLVTESNAPLLVVGEQGRGRTAALATDVAPHWVGGLVDWGDGRVTAQAAGAEAVEVGDLYAQFLLQTRLLDERRLVGMANALIGQSGGPTSVINSSLVGVVDAARSAKKIGCVFGMRFGIEGVLNNHLVDLSGQPKEVLKGLRSTPSSALGSSRLKLQDEHFAPILKQLKKYDIRYLFMIGGNDTMDTIHRVTTYAAEHGYEMCGVGVPKTVDNDLYGTDHTPGFPSAARYVAMSMLQAGLLARDMQKVDQFVIFQTVGRSAGWLPAAAVSARHDTGDPPHVLLLPERPFDRDAFLGAVKKAHEKHGFVSIVCGEGITNTDGSPVSASQTMDKFQNVEFGAMGGTSAAMILHRIVSDEFGWRGEFQVTESLQMCAADRGAKLDFQEAYDCGKQAVRLALAEESGVMVTIDRLSDDPYRIEFGTAPLADVANHERPLPDRFITKDGMGVTAAFRKYVAPLVGPLPKYARLDVKKAKP